MLSKFKKDWNSFDNRQKMLFAGLMFILIFSVIFVVVVFRKYIVGAIIVAGMAYMLFGEAIFKAYLNNKNYGSTCGDCNACGVKYDYISQLIYDAFASKRTILEIDIPRSYHLIQTREPVSPRYKSKYGFPSMLPRFWFKVSWLHPKTIDELEAMISTEEVRFVLHKAVDDLFMVREEWFFGSPIRGLWIDIVEMDTYGIRVMIIPYCIGETKEYIDARMMEEIQRNSEPEHINSEEIVYDDELL